MLCVAPTFVQPTKCHSHSSESLFHGTILPFPLIAANLRQKTGSKTRCQMLSSPYGVLRWSGMVGLPRLLGHQGPPSLYVVGR